jgi:hypothetical protein
MEPLFWCKFAISFMVGSSWVALSTVAAEKYGSKIGGLIGGLPSTVFVALLFIGLTQSPLIASQATTVIPISQGFNGLVLVVYMLFIERGLVAGLASSLLAWACLASLLIASGIQSFWISVGGWGILVLICALAVERWMHIPSQGKIAVRLTALQIAVRALFGGAMIALAVLVGRLGGPVYGGVFATFPAMFISTLIITYRAGGAGFSRAVAKSLLVSGMVNVALYAIAVRFLYVWVGLAYGTALALLFSLGTGYLTYLLISRKLS